MHSTFSVSELFELFRICRAQHHAHTQWMHAHRDRLFLAKLERLSPSGELWVLIYSSYISFFLLSVLCGELASARIPLSIANFSEREHINTCERENMEVEDPSAKPNNLLLHFFSFSFFFFCFISFSFPSAFSFRHLASEHLTMQSIILVFSKKQFFKVIPVDCNGIGWVRSLNGLQTICSLCAILLCWWVRSGISHSAINSYSLLSLRLRGIWNMEGCATKRQKNIIDFHWNSYFRLNRNWFQFAVSGTTRFQCRLWALELSCVKF